jgi:hypothetical protein
MKSVCPKCKKPVDVLDMEHGPDGAKVCLACAVAEPETRTRKPRADRGRPRKLKAGPWILQVTTSPPEAELTLWTDSATAQTERGAWELRIEKQIAGTCRVIRQHGETRTGQLQQRLVDVES